ncbi:MAG: N-acetylmuramoyl-L-alanine amidase [Bacteroidota bacterium]
MKQLELLIIHCTSTPEGRPHTGADIRAWHTSAPPKGRGWKQVGYSDLIHLRGTVENLVPYDGDNIVQPREVTNGAVGTNQKARHVCYVGGMSKDRKKAKDTRTLEQLEAMKAYVLKMIAKHPQIKVAGHNQFAVKACPSFDVRAWARSIGVKDENIYLSDLIYKL